MSSPHAERTDFQDLDYPNPTELKIAGINDFTYPVDLDEPTNLRDYRERRSTTPLTIVGNLERPEMTPQEVVDRLIPGSIEHQAAVIESTARWLQRQLSTQKILTDQHSRLAVLLSKSSQAMMPLRPEVQGRLQAQISQALGTFLERHKGEVAGIVYKYQNSGSSLTTDDLFMEGQIGFLQALGRYDLHYTNEVVGYCLHRARGNAVDAVRDNGRVIKASRSAFDLKRKILSDQDYISRLPEKEANAAYEELSRLSQTTVASLDQQLELNDGDVVNLHDFVADPSSTEDFENLEKTQSEARILEFVDGLPYKLREILKMNIGLKPYEDVYTLQQIGHAMGVTESRASQLLTKALDRLRSELIA